MRRALIPWGALAGLLVAPGVAGADTAQPGALAVVQALEAARDRGDTMAAVHLFADDARAYVLGSTVDQLVAALPRAGGLRNRLFLPWCPARQVCRFEADGYMVRGERAQPGGRAGQGGSQTVTWRVRVFASMTTLGPLPWEVQEEADVRPDGRISSLVTWSAAEWERQHRAAQDAQAQADQRRLVEVIQTATAAARQPGTATPGLLVQPSATPTAITLGRAGVPQAPSTQTRGSQTPGAWLAGALAMLGTALVALRRTGP